MAKAKLTDAQVEEILRAPAEVTSAALAGRLGVGRTTVNGIRSRRTWRALKLAQALGLEPPTRHRTVWAGSRSDAVKRVPLDRVKRFAGGQLPSPGPMLRRWG